jgi:hypothetical protein
MNTSLASLPGITDFDFLNGTWDTHNRRQNADGVWEEFDSTITASMEVDGLVQVEYFDCPAFPSRGHVKAVTIRAFDTETQEWSLLWLSNYAPPDFQPVVGRFEDGIGRFSAVAETPEGKPWHIQFVWDEITENSARWRQRFSFDEGRTWELNWEAEHTRRS